MIRIVDHDGAPGAVPLAEQLRDRIDIAIGIIHLPVGTLDATVGRFADAVLEALGKRPVERDLPRGDTRKWQRIRAWTLGERINTMVVTGAENLSVMNCVRLLELQEICGLDLFLVARSGPQGTRWRRRALDWGAEVCDVDQLLEAVPPIARTPEPAPFPQPPTDDFLKFLYTAARELHPEEFVRVEDAFVHGQSKTVDWVKSQKRLDPEAIAAWVRFLLDDIGSHNEAICILRGVEAGFFVSGSSHGVDLRVAKFARHARLARRDDLAHGAATRLRWLSNNDEAMAALARLLSHCSVDDLVNLRVRDVAEDGSAITIAGHDFPIPENAQGFARTQLIDRVFDAASPDDALLIVEQTKEGRRPAPRGTISVWLHRITTFTDVVVAERWTPRVPQPNQRWLTSMGLRVFEYGLPKKR